MSRAQKYRKLLRNMKRIENGNKVLQDRIRSVQDSMKSSILIDQTPFLDEKVKHLYQESKRISDMLNDSIIPDIERDIEEEEDGEE